MDTLNNDIYQYIFLLLPISDKRSFIRVCKNTYSLSSHMALIEREFHAMINETRFFSYQYYGLHYPLYRYSMELLYDGYDIPDNYIISENRMLHQFPKIYKKLGERGNLDLIKKILPLSCNYVNALTIMRGAAKVGAIDILEWMIENNYDRHYYAVQGAISGNKINVLIWLLDNGWEQNSSAIPHAAARGHGDIIKFLISRNWKIDNAVFWAASRGHIELVKYLFSVNNPGPMTIDNIANGAACSGNLDLLKYVLNNGFRLNNIFCGQHIHIYEWLIENNLFKYDITMMQYIAHYGNLECLQYLHSKKYNILDEQVFAEAVVSRNIELIIWLHELDCPSDESAVCAAIREPADAEKTIVILKLLINWGCKLPEDICTVAARNGDLETLKFLYAQRCPINVHTLIMAAGNGHLHIIIWCRSQGCAWNENVCAQSAIHHYLDELKWLRGVNRDICELKSNETEICPWDEQVCIYAIRSNQIDVLKFALENVCKISNVCFDTAVRYDDREIIDLVKCYL
uniref:Uncharacterized protein n=1 Tax=viral metagenome TaxID=1070528 RepID=A0A6C0CAR3_9ZZZZ